MADEKTRDELAEALQRLEQQLAGHVRVTRVIIDRDSTGAWVEVGRVVRTCYQPTGSRNPHTTENSHE